MKKSVLLAFSAVLLLALSACSITTRPDMGPDVRGFYEGTTVPEDAIDVTMQTSMGDIQLRLFPSEAPKAVENFVTLAKEGYYDGLLFHRVIPDFMIQAGDPSGDGTGGESIWGEGFETEFNGRLYHFYGAISMANTGAENSNGSQFFIVDSDSVAQDYIDAAKDWPRDALDIYEEVGGALHLDGNHPVFGYVTEGMDVVEAISEVEIDANDKPVEDVLIETIVVNDA